MDDEFTPAKLEGIRIEPVMPIVITMKQLLTQVNAGLDFMQRGEDGSSAIFAVDPNMKWLLLGSGDPKVIKESGNGIWVDREGNGMYG